MRKEKKGKTQEGIEEEDSEMVFVAAKSPPKETLETIENGNER